MLSTSYKRYALAAMTTVYTVNLFDRGLMYLLLEPIKKDLSLSDTQLGFVTGIAFGVFYAGLGIPIARWADRGNRVTITTLAIGLWGLTSMLYMFVSNFFHLLLARIAAGIGDSGGPAPMYSLLGDYFEKAAERTQAMYVWTLAGPLSALLSFVAGGWLNERYGWRLTFLLIGLLGIALAFVVKATLIEPRERMHAARTTEAKPWSLSEVVAVLWRQRSCRHLTLSLILLVTVAQGVTTWQAAFMIRMHGISTSELGVWMGLIMGGGGVAGLLLGRFVVGRWFADNDRAQVRLAAVSITASGPLFVVFLMASSKEQALLVLFLQFVLLMAFSASLFALLQRLVPDAMRATAMTVQLFFANIIGMGVGPLMVGVLSDLFQPTFGAEGLRYALLIMSLLWIWAGYHLLRVGRTIEADLLAVVVPA